MPHQTHNDSLCCTNKPHDCLITGSYVALLHRSLPTHHITQLLTANPLLMITMNMSHSNLFDWISLRTLITSVTILSLISYRAWKRNAQRRVSLVEKSFYWSSRSFDCLHTYHRKKINMQREWDVGRRENWQQNGRRA